jgi:hypothetical protein
MKKCTECKSTNLEYLPNVDGQSWVHTTYVQKDDQWVAKVQAKNDDDKWVDVSKIDTNKIYYNDGMSFFSCLDCTAEIDGRYI